MHIKPLERFIQQKLVKTKLPGLSIALIEGDEVVWARGFGFRDIEQGYPATPNTLYGIASITKSFTCLAIMKLAADGKLSVDDPIDKHIPFHSQPQDEPVRIKHLMSHTSGLPALAYAENFIRNVVGADENWLPIATYDDMLTFLDGAEDWRLANPGERWFYLNEGYVLLGYIIEQCSGMPYADFVQQTILEPLGMAHSFFDKNRLDDEHDVAIPYVTTGDSEHLPSVYPLGTLIADGGLVSNVMELARYIAMYLGEGRYKDTQLIDFESIQEMFTPRINTPMQNGPFGQYQYGYGLGTTPDFLGHRLISHGGSLGITTSYMGFIPQKNMGVAVMANGTGYAMSQFGQAALAIMLGETLETLPFIQRENRLAELAGHYASYKGTIRWHVRQNGDFLVIEEKTRFSESVTTLIPDNLEEERRNFYTLSAGHVLPVEFRVYDNHIDLIYERYLLRRNRSV